MLRLTKTNDADEEEVSRHTGKLEIYHHNQWIPVCFENWGRQETHIVCKHLGYVEGAATGVRDESLTNTNWMTNVTCSGSESRLDACASGFVFNGCPSFEHVSIICS